MVAFLLGEDLFFKVLHLSGMYLIIEVVLPVYLQTIQTVCPDIVMIELCSGRTGIIKYDEETLLREAKDISMAKLKLAIKEVSFKV